MERPRAEELDPPKAHPARRAAAFALVASERAVARHRLTPRARVHHISARGADPVYMLTAPIKVTRYALRRAGMGIDDIDLFELNEAFASVLLGWLGRPGRTLSW